MDDLESKLRKLAFPEPSERFDGRMRMLFASASMFKGRSIRLHRTLVLSVLASTACLIIGVAATFAAMRLGHSPASEDSPMPKRIYPKSVGQGSFLDFTCASDDGFGVNSKITIRKER